MAPPGIPSSNKATLAVPPPVRSPDNLNQRKGVDLTAPPPTLEPKPLIPIEEYYELISPDQTKTQQILGELDNNGFFHDDLIGTSDLIVEAKQVLEKGLEKFSPPKNVSVGSSEYKQAFINFLETSTEFPLLPINEQKKFLSSLQVDESKTPLFSRDEINDHVKYYTLTWNKSRRLGHAFRLRADSVIDKNLSGAAKLYSSAVQYDLNNIGLRFEAAKVFYELAESRQDNPFVHEKLLTNALEFVLAFEHRAKSSNDPNVLRKLPEAIQLKGELTQLLNKSKASSQPITQFSVQGTPTDKIDQLAAKGKSITELFKNPIQNYSQLQKIFGTLPFDTSGKLKPELGRDLIKRLSQAKTFQEQTQLYFRHQGNEAKRTWADPVLEGNSKRIQTGEYFEKAFLAGGKIQDAYHAVEAFYGAAGIARGAGSELDAKLLLLRGVEVLQQAERLTGKEKLSRNGTALTLLGKGLKEAGKYQQAAQIFEQARQLGVQSYDLVHDIATTTAQAKHQKEINVFLNRLSTLEGKEKAGSLTAQEKETLNLLRGAQGLLRTVHEIRIPGYLPSSPPAALVRLQQRVVDALNHPEKILKVKGEISS